MAAILLFECTETRKSLPVVSSIRSMTYTRVNLILSCSEHWCTCIMNSTLLHPLLDYHNITYLVFTATSTSCYFFLLSNVFGATC